MSSYWSKRRSYALIQAENAQSPALKAIYLQLAAHYLKLQRAVEVPTDNRD